MDEAKEVLAGPEEMLQDERDQSIARLQKELSALREQCDLGPNSAKF